MPGRVLLSKAISTSEVKYRRSVFRCLESIILPLKKELLLTQCSQQQFFMVRNLDD